MTDDTAHTKEWLIHAREWWKFEEDLTKIFKDVSGEVFNIDDEKHYDWWTHSESQILCNMIYFGLNWRDAMDKYARDEAMNYWAWLTEEL